ncbi:MAG TPA: hypothetical protein DCQ64_31060 [Candidatus Rokubacteria bacterium]|nr:hypothetical protein [Candidatus Rokubacteria bacterium]
MQLTVADRLLLLQLLPTEGDVTTLRVVRDARAAIGLTEFELKRFEVVQDNGTVRWSNSKAESVEIELGAAAAGIISADLQERNKARKLTEAHLPLYEKFCERSASGAAAEEEEDGDREEKRAS